MRNRENVYKLPYANDGAVAQEIIASPIVEVMHKRMAHVAALVAAGERDDEQVRTLLEAVEESLATKEAMIESGVVASDAQKVGALIVKQRAQRDALAKVLAEIGARNDLLQQWMAQEHALQEAFVRHSGEAPNDAPTVEKILAALAQLRERLRKYDDLAAQIAHATTSQKSQQVTVLVDEKEKVQQDKSDRGQFMARQERAMNERMDRYKEEEEALEQFIQDIGAYGERNAEEHGYEVFAQMLAAVLKKVRKRNCIVTELYAVEQRMRTLEEGDSSQERLYSEREMLRARLAHFSDVSREVADIFGDGL